MNPDLNPTRTKSVFIRVYLWPSPCRLDIWESASLEERHQRPVTVVRAHVAAAISARCGRGTRITRLKTS